MRDNKTRLEEAKKRKAFLLAELRKDSQSVQNQSTPSSSTSTISSSRNAGESEETHPSSPDQPKQSSKKPRSTVQIFEDPTTNALLQEIYKKRICQSLSISAFSDFLMGIFPPTSENYSQYEYAKEEEKEQPQKKEKEEEPMRNRKLSIQRRMSIPEEEKKAEEDKRKKKELTNEMRLEFIQKNEAKLTRFLRAEKDMFEKAFSENDLFDICQTYYIEEDLDIDISKRQLVTTQTELYDETLCEGRAVTSLEWAKMQDLLLTGFSKSNDLNERDGLILLWNLINKKSEYTINCQTELTTSILNPYNSNMIIAGNYIGQILIYDTKSKPIPVFKTPLGIKSEAEKNDKNVVHTHQLPISCLGLTGVATNHSLISLSEGIMCVWSLANMSRPLYYIDLKKNKAEDKYNLNQIKALSISFSTYQSDSVYIGSDYNEIFQISTLKGKTNEEIVSTYKGHLGPVNSVDIHPGETHNDLFISASSDWTAKLWHRNYSYPLMSFDVTDDYVYSAKWHPFNPSMFVSSDGLGHLDFWDLNKDLEVPTFRYEHKSCINKMAWYHDGKKMAVGDAVGKVSVLGVEKDLYSTKAEDSSKFTSIVHSLLAAEHKEED